MSSENPFSVKVDLGIADVVRSIDAIFARRRDRKTKSLADMAYSLCDDLDVCSESVKALDDLFIKLVEGFSGGEIASKPALLKGHVVQTQQYLKRRDFLPRLEQRIGAIKSAAFDSRLKNKEHRGLVLALRSLTSQLQLYRNNLGKGAITGVGQNKDWNLQTLCERALRKDHGGGKLEPPLEAMAEEVYRNHDFEVSDNISRLIGTVRRLAEPLRQ